MLPAEPGSPPRTVVIVGASGFIGRNLVRHLKGRIDRIVPVAREARRVEDIAGISLEDLERSDIENDAIIVDVAAVPYEADRFGKGQADILVGNVGLTGRLYRFCAAKGITEVRLASSVAVYPASEAEFDDAYPVSLDGEPHPAELLYAWSKRIGETYAKLFAAEYGINTISFRLTNPYGPYDSLDEGKAHVIPAFVMRALTSVGPFAVRGDPEASRDFIFVGDVCDVIARSLSWRGRNGAYNVGTGENTTIGAVARTILDLVGSNREIVSSGNSVSGVRVRRCRVDRLRDDFSISRFRSLSEGLVPTIDWYRDALHLGP